MDKQLLSNLINANFKRTPEHDFSDGFGGKVHVFGVEGDTLICKFWNSSNKNYFEKKLVLQTIASKYLDDHDLCEGRISEYFKEIMFEIVEK